MTEEKKRGGARPGSGRKNTGVKKVTISFRVSEDVRDRIQFLRAEGIDVNHKLEEIIMR